MISNSSSRKFSYLNRGVAALFFFGRTFLLVLILGFAKSVTAAENSSITLDPEKLELASVSALITDAYTGESLYRKNASLVVPIASITKVMTAMIVLDSKQPLDEYLRISKISKTSGKNSYSRLRIGSTAKRKDLLRLALMASDNRAADTLGTSVPGGLAEFVRQMNRKASELNMKQTIFVDSTGLSVGNVSTARDVSRMLEEALKYPLIQEYSTTRRYTTQFRKPKYRLTHGNTNILVHRKWDIQLSKTGFLNEAGRCLALVVDIDSKPYIMVLLDSYGKRTPVGDVGRVRRWMRTGSSGKIVNAAKVYEKEKTKQRLLELFQ